MMFSSKAEERVDKKDMVSNVFMCRKLYFVCFYSVLFLLLTMILFIYSRFQQDLFATFDLPEMRDGVGHYCVVALNVKERWFEFLDSLNKPGNPDAIRVFRRMVKNIKRAWK